MLKYRRLSKEELEALEDEFVKFLSAQSISAPDWQNIKSQNPRKTRCLDRHVFKHCDGKSIRQYRLP